MVGGSQLICNPETSDIYTLIGWYSRMKDTVEFKDFQNTGNSNMTSGGYTTNYEKLTQVFETIKCFILSIAGLSHPMDTLGRPFILLTIIRFKQKNKGSGRI